MDKRNKETNSLKSAFSELLKSYKLESKYNAAKIMKDWPELVGKPIANRTAKIRISNGKITVYLTSAPLKQELNMSKSKILTLLRNKYGEETVKDIIFL